MTKYFCILIFLGLHSSFIGCLKAQPSHQSLSPIFGSCIYGEWSEWTACWASCGVDVQRSRFRTVSMNNSGDMAMLSFNCEESIHEQQNCELAPCPNDCILSVWSDWGPCNCQINQTERTRTILRMPRGNGRVCSEMRQVVACGSNETCVRDCQLSGWSVWSECSATCGQGIAMRQRTALTSAINGGVPCTERVQITDCAMAECKNAADPCGNLTGTIPDPANECSRFYINCVSGRLMWFMCPGGLRFHERIGRCDYVENVLPQCANELKRSNGGSLIDYRLFKSLAMVSSALLIKVMVLPH